MNLGRKIAIAKSAIESITQHDDAPFADRVDAMSIVQAAIADEMTAAAARDAERRRAAMQNPPHE